MHTVVTLEEALGKPLAHDITEVRPGEFKGAAFHKGHIVRPEDLNHLRRLGKEHLFIIDMDDDELHEDEAAVMLADALCGSGIFWEGPPREGKLALKARHDGLLKIDREALTAFNLLAEVMCASQHNNIAVKQGDTVAATRAIPLTIKREIVEAAIRICKNADGIVRLLPIPQVKACVLITGNEVFYGRIKDKFEAVTRQKVSRYNGEVLQVLFAPDDDIVIAEKVTKLIKIGAEVIITTGGMSVDPDDRTRFALRRAGATNIIYGSGVLPGAMLMTCRVNNVPVISAPACAMYSAVTAFDLIYPRLLAGETITRKDLAELGYGGLCLQCETCRYPICPFGKA